MTSRRAASLLRFGLWCRLRAPCASALWAAQRCLQNSLPHLPQNRFSSCLRKSCCLHLCAALWFRAFSRQRCRLRRAICSLPDRLYRRTFIRVSSIERRPMLRRCSSRAWRLRSSLSSESLSRSTRTLRSSKSFHTHGPVSARASAPLCFYRCIGVARIGRVLLRACLRVQ